MDTLIITKILPPVIWYEHKGDEICWNGNEYISLCCGGSFKTLDELDKFWEDYFEEEKKQLTELRKE